MLESDGRCSQAKCCIEFSDGKVSLVVDLHFLVVVDLGLDARLEVLELKLALHAGAFIRCVANEASLAERAAIVTGCLKVENDEYWVSTKLSYELLKSIFSWSGLDEINT